MQLVRIVREVEEQVGIAGADGELESPAHDRHLRSVRPLGEVLDEDVPVPRPLLPCCLPTSRFEEGEPRETPIGVVGDPAGAGVRDLDEGGGEVEQGDGVGVPAGEDHLGGACDDERDPGRLLVRGHLVPEPFLPEHVAVIARDDDDGVRVKSEIAQARHDRPDVVVDVGHGGIVGPPGTADILDGRLPFVEPGHRPQPVAVGIDGRVGNLGVGGVGDGRLGEAVPVLPGRFVRVVGVDERGDHEERLVLAGRLVRPLPVAQVAQGPEDHLVVEVLLDVRRRRARGEDGVGLVVPLEPVVERSRPVGDHVEVGRVDVGRQPLLEAVVLVGADEVHPPDEGGVVAELAQPVGERRHRSGEVIAVVEAVDLRGHAPGHHRRPRGGAQRSRPVGTVEDGTGFCELVDVRGQGRLVAVGAESFGRHLVGLDDDDVRGLHMLVTSLRMRARPSSGAP
ncbi:Uncharacterised protein [Mycobacteroides abscessus subsp. abscessus]|nr:Uncharacterised protein [Mycobacteroides abscessus subsp. abscessus]